MSTGTTARAAFKQLNTQDSLLLKQVLQKVKPELVVQEEMTTGTTRLLHLNKNNIQKDKNPEAVFNSLLQKSASITTRGGRTSYEEIFNDIYNK
jgi:hypothetical protein